MSVDVILGGGILLFILSIGCTFFIRSPYILGLLVLILTAVSAAVMYRGKHANAPSTDSATSDFSPDDDTQLSSPSPPLERPRTRTTLSRSRGVSSTFPTTTALSDHRPPNREDEYLGQLAASDRMDHYLDDLEHRQPQPSLQHPIVSSNTTSHPPPRLRSGVPHAQPDKVHVVHEEDDPFRVLIHRRQEHEFDENVTDKFLEEERRRDFVDDADEVEQMFESDAQVYENALSRRLRDANGGKDS